VSEGFFADTILSLALSTAFSYSITG